VFLTTLLSILVDEENPENKPNRALKNKKPTNGRLFICNLTKNYFFISPAGAAASAGLAASAAGAAGAAASAGLAASAGAAAGAAGAASAGLGASVLLQAASEAATRAAIRRECFMSIPW